MIEYGLTGLLTTGSGFRVLTGEPLDKQNAKLALSFNSRGAKSPLLPRSWPWPMALRQEEPARRGTKGLSGSLPQTREDDLLRYADLRSVAQPFGYAGALQHSALVDENPGTDVPEVG